MRFALSLAAVLGCLTAECRIASAEDFRIETKIYAIEKNKLLSENITLFHKGVVYDFLEPAQIAVFDKPHGRFVLLDTARKLRTDISTQELLVFCGELRAWATDSSKVFLKFCGDPQFAKAFSERSGELTMTSQYMSYKLQTTKAKTPEAAHQMREFTDWYARLNALTNPSGMLPFPRLAVNDELDRRGMVATQVELNIPAQYVAGRNQAIAVRSEHDVKWQLLDRDLHKISETDEQLVKFAVVSYGVFATEPETAVNQPQASK